MNRLSLVLAAILLVPIVPFVILHESVEAQLDAVMDRSPGPTTIMALVVGVLATDVFLPVPSSFVSTLAGGQLTPVKATIASWLGYYYTARQLDIGHPPVRLQFGQNHAVDRVELVTCHE